MRPANSLSKYFEARRAPNKSSWTLVNKFEQKRFELFSGLIVKKVVLLQLFSSFFYFCKSLSEQNRFDRGLLIFRRDF